MKKVKLVTVLFFGCILSACGNGISTLSLPTATNILTPIATSALEEIPSPTPLTTSYEFAYEIHLRQFDPTTPFALNVPYPNEIKALGDEDLLGLGCSPRYFSWTGTGHGYTDPITQEEKKISDLLMQDFLASAELLNPGKNITSISYCTVENENPIVIYQVGGCGGGCVGIPNISFGTSDGSLALITTIPTDGSDGAYYSCDPLLLTKQQILYLACRGEGTDIIRKVDLTNSSVEIVLSCKVTIQGFPEVVSHQICGIK